METMGLKNSVQVNDQVTNEDPICLDFETMPGAASGFRTFSATEIFSKSSEPKAFFEEYGYLVVTDVLTSTEVAEALDKFRAFMAHHDVDVTNPKNMKCFGDSFIGLVGKCAAGHSAMNWFVRSRQAVKSVFRMAHSMSDDAKLITSFDGFNWFRNPEADAEYQGNTTQWFHWDANKWADGDKTVQGLVNLIDCLDPHDAGLVVLPRSHKTLFRKVVEENPQHSARIKYVGRHEIRQIHAAKIEERSHRVPLPAGSMVVWKSSLMHCNTGCLHRAVPQPGQAVRRLASYVCMGPDPRDIKLSEKRLEAFHNGKTTTHEPHLCLTIGDRPRDGAVEAGVVIVKEERLPEGAKELL